MPRRLATSFACLITLATSGCKRDTPSPPAQAKSVAPAGGSGGSAAPAANGAVSRTVGPFTEVEISTSLEIDLAIGPAGPLEITGDPAMVAAVQTDVTGGVLEIRLPPNSSFSTHEPLVVHAKTPELTALRASTSARATVRGLAAANLTVRASTAAHVELSGTCKALSVTASESAHVDAASLHCETVTLQADTAAQLRVDASSSVTGHATTASHVQISGNPPTVAVATETAASVEH